MKKLGYDMSLQDFMDKLRNDPNNYHSDPDTMMEDFKDIVNNQIGPRITKIFSKFPEHKLE